MSNSNSKPGQKPKPKPKSPVRMLDPVEILIQYEFVQLITEHFSDLWVSFDGDMSEMLILGIIGQTQLSMFLGQTEPVIFDASKHRGISASRISDVTKIPRQTVRRKLLRMEERGLLLQDERQRWRLVINDDGSVPAQEIYAGLYARGIERAKRLAVALKPYV